VRIDAMSAPTLPTTASPISSQPTGRYVMSVYKRLGIV
jgi:hypothetical protein